MKQTLLFALFLVLSGSLAAQQTIYVKANASGANNGTSWQNAYTQLSDALAAATPGDQVWVAAGTYLTAQGTPESSFQMLAGVALYGGFNGTETTLTARNPVTNVTILSGDHSGDDVAGDFTQKRSDNSIHVLQVLEGTQSGQRAIVDGFTIKGGYTTSTAPNPDQTRGGGILAFAKLTVRNCNFTDNFATSGGGLAAFGMAASGILIDNCLFEKNGAELLCAGVFLRDLLDGGEVNRCVFRNNTTIRGSLYIYTSLDIVVDSCLFENNTAGNNPCAGMYTWQSTFTLTNSIFRNNKSVDYTAMYNDGRDGAYPFTIDNCIFEGNEAVDLTSASNVATGGCIFNANTTSVIKNSSFLNNSAHLGGAIYMSGKSQGLKNVIENCVFDGNTVSTGANTSASRGGSLYSFKADYEVKNCQFSGGTAGTSGALIHHADSSLFYIHDSEFKASSAAFGGAVSNYNAGTVGTYENCTFNGNAAATSGGAMTSGFTANVTVKDCRFESNTARFGAGIFAQNNLTRVTVLGSTITNNVAEGTGGGVNMSAGIKFTMDDCTVEVNTADIGGGVAISDDTVNVGQTIIRNTVFLSNFAGTQAAGLNVSNTDVELENCLFVANQNAGTGAGGAISNNASGSTSPIHAVNCTFADNAAAIGGGIAQWEDATGTATLTLQNCILFNNLVSDYQIEDGQPEVISMGGNLSGDQSLADVLTGTNDLVESNPMFVDPDFFNYHLQAGSPCIDKGIATGAPVYDLDGAPRDANPDQGCYEFGAVGTHQAGNPVQALQFMPNPAVERTFLVIDNDWSGEAQVRLVSQNGAQVNAFTANKPAGRWVLPLVVRDLPAGVYSVQVLLGQTWHEGSLVKK